MDTVGARRAAAHPGVADDGLVRNADTTVAPSELVTLKKAREFAAAASVPDRSCTTLEPSHSSTTHVRPSEVTAYSRYRVPLASPDTVARTVTRCWSPEMYTVRLAPLWLSSADAVAARRMSVAPPPPVPVTAIPSATPMNTTSTAVSA